MLDRDEGGLHKVQLQIEGRALLDDRNLVVADIRDRERMEDVFDEHRPEVVFHAAALKHLPLLEMHPAEGIKTNIWGTQNLLDVAAATGVERFVNVSTDKAADPCSVLGYTKRIAERLTASMAEATDGTYLSVRFGNVLGSRGSVSKQAMQHPDRGAKPEVGGPHRGLIAFEANSAHLLFAPAQLERSDLGMEDWLEAWGTGRKVRRARHGWTHRTSHRGAAQ